MFARSCAVISKRAFDASLLKTAVLPPRLVALQGSNATTTTASTTLTQNTRRLVHIEKRLEDKGIKLPAPSAPKANYDICCHASGNMLYISGHLPTTVEDGSLMTGKIGGGLDEKDEEGKSVEHGYAAARLAGLAIVSTLKEQLGDLDRVEQIVKVLYGERYFVCDFWYYHSFIYLSRRRCRGAHSKTEFLLYISVCHSFSLAIHAMQCNRKHPTTTTLKNVSSI